MTVHEVVDVLIGLLEGNHSSFTLSLSWSCIPFDFASDLKSDIISGLFLDGLEGVISCLASTECVNVNDFCLAIIFGILSSIRGKLSNTSSILSSQCSMVLTIR